MNDRQIFEPCERTKRAVEHEGKLNIYCIWCIWNRHQLLREGNKGNGDHWKKKHHSDHNVAEIRQHSDKNS